MKKNLLIIIIILNICTSTFAQSPTDSLDIKVALKDEYVIGDVINFEYFNKSQNYLRVHISMERADAQGKWIPFFHEIFCEHEFKEYDNIIWIILHSHLSLSKYSDEQIKKYRKDKWTVKKSCLYGQETIALFRFKYTIGINPFGLVYKETGTHPKETVYYSKPFYIKRSKSVKKNELNKYGYNFYLMDL